MSVCRVCAIVPGLITMLVVLPGCVVWDINDGILASNDNLGRIEDELQAIDKELVVVNSNLQTVDSQMSSMGTTLTSMDTQLKSLQAQLDATNTHLASLRKTINNIDSTIPFLKLSGDDEEEQEALENEGGEQATPPADPAPGTRSEPNTGGANGK